MIISKSNVASLATITDSPVSALQDINVIADGDYSSTYSDALPTTHTTTFVFSAAQNIGYIAISGNVSQKTSIDIQFNSASVVNKSLAATDPQVMMFKVDQANVTQVDVIVTGTGSIAITELAMGEYFTGPNGGEQAGYKRPWTVPNREARGAKSLNKAPVSLTYQARNISASLSIPNHLMTDFADWYEFLDYATQHTFYILEDDNELHSCAGFNLNPSATAAHGSTRLMGVQSITFDAYSKGMITI